MKASTLFSAGMLALAGIGFVGYQLFDSGQDVTPSSAQTEFPIEETQQPFNAADNEDESFARLADVWQAPEEEIEAAPIEEKRIESVPYSGGLVRAHHLHEPTIRQSLQDIKLDENGDVMLDTDALHALRKAFDHGNMVLDNEAMSKLMDMIHQALPTDIAQQTSKVVKDFHDYNVALQQRKDEWGRPQNIDERIALLDEQAELQQLFMGEETAGLLFSVENTSTRQMLEGMNIAVDESLSREEKNEKLDELFQRYAEATPKIMNWDSRYDQFQFEKQAILDAAISQQEKEDQVQELYQHSFSASERALLVNRDLNQI